MILVEHQRVMRCLRGEIDENSRAYMSKEDAYRKLKAVSGLDFGWDVDAWQRWVSANKDKFYGRDRG